MTAPPTRSSAPMTLKRMMVMSFHSGQGARPLMRILIFSRLKSLTRSMQIICVSSNSVVNRLRLRCSVARYSLPSSLSTITIPTRGYECRSSGLMVRLKSNLWVLLSRMGQAPMSPRLSMSARWVSRVLQTVQSCWVRLPSLRSSGMECLTRKSSLVWLMWLVTSQQEQRRQMRVIFLETSWEVLPQVTASCSVWQRPVVRSSLSVVVFLAGSLDEESRAMAWKVASQGSVSLSSFSRARTSMKTIWRMTMSGWLALCVNSTMNSPLVISLMQRRQVPLPALQVSYALLIKILPSSRMPKSSPSRYYNCVSGSSLSASLLISQRKMPPLVVLRQGSDSVSTSISSSLVTWSLNRLVASDYIGSIANGLLPTKEVTYRYTASSVTHPDTSNLPPSPTSIWAHIFSLFSGKMTICPSEPFWRKLTSPPVVWADPPRGVQTQSVMPTTPGVVPSVSMWLQILILVPQSWQVGLMQRTLPSYQSVSLISLRWLQPEKSRSLVFMMSLRKGLTVMQVGRLMIFTSTSYNCPASTMLKYSRQNLQSSLGLMISAVGNSYCRKTRNSFPETTVTQSTMQPLASMRMFWQAKRLIWLQSDPMAGYPLRQTNTLQTPPSLTVERYTQFPQSDRSNSQFLGSLYPYNGQRFVMRTSLRYKRDRSYSWMMLGAMVTTMKLTLTSKMNSTSELATGLIVVRSLGLLTLLRSTMMMESEVLMKMTLGVVRLEWTDSGEKYFTPRRYMLVWLIQLEQLQYFSPLMHSSSGQTLIRFTCFSTTYMNLLVIVKEVIFPGKLLPRVSYSLPSWFERSSMKILLQQISVEQAST